jgi:two-component system, OmpR family, sensor histidine kinase ChvG
LARVCNRAFSSLTFKAVLLIGVFVALPFVISGQLRDGNEKVRDLLQRSIEQHSWLIAQSLQSLLNRPGLPPEASLQSVLDRYALDGTRLDLLYRPSKPQASGSFYYVASSAAGGTFRLDDRLDAMLTHGVLAKLPRSCKWDAPSELHYTDVAPKGEVVTWVLPIASPSGCWALVYSHVDSEFLGTAIRRPYWDAPRVRIAAVIYSLVALLALMVAESVWRNIRKFRRAAREISEGRAQLCSFAACNVVPELESVAADFDRLVVDLCSVAHSFREAAEDNAHSFKGPIATIDASLQPIRRLAEGSDERTRRSLELVDSSLRRLQTLVVASQRLGDVTMSVMQAPIAPVDLTSLITDAISRIRVLLNARNIVLQESLAEGVMVSAGAGVCESIVDNILENAISFSPVGGVVAITLRVGRFIHLQIDDEGPGVDPRNIDQIFERYVSIRPQQPVQGAERIGQRGDAGPPAGSSHAGLGLWIVRRNVESLGGRVLARNRPGGGFSVHVILPCEHSRGVARAMAAEEMAPFSSTI